MIFISTGGRKDKTAYDVGIEFIASGIDILELSGGKYMPESINLLKELKKNSTLRIHNYFPPPKEPFVFNLASMASDIADLSMKHVLQAIDICSELELPVYSFHAGFLLDPKPGDLGKTIPLSRIQNRNDSLQLFLERIDSVSRVAKSRGVDLLVENNVLSKNNHNVFGENPLLMVTPDECEYVMSNTPNNVNMLLDVAHLKVSAFALGFNQVEFFNSCKSWIKAYHLSDNDGTADTNMPVESTSWFWPYLNRDVDYITLEVYNCAPSVMHDQLLLVNSKLKESSGFTV